MSTIRRSCLTINLSWAGHVESVAITCRPPELGAHLRSDGDGPCLTGIPFLRLMTAIVSECPEMVPEILEVCGLDAAKAHFGLVELSEPKP